MNQEGQDSTKDEKDKVSLSRQEYEELKKQAEKGKESYDQYVRTYAELENARKRFSKEKSELAKFANIELISVILPIIDNFDRALESIEKNGEQNSELIENPVLAGVELIRKQFHTFLDQQGVKPFDSVGEKFDPHRHEALMEVETEDQEAGIVMEEIQKGYYLQDRLIRPAVVKIAKKPKPKIDQGGLDNG